MGWHTVDQGEYLANIAKAHEFRDWRTIYDHPQNAAFRKKRPNPNVIFPGDVLYIPDKNKKTVSKPTGAKHVFLVKRAQLKLKMILKDHKGKALSGLAYTLEIGGKTYRDKTDAQGAVEQSIPIDSSEGQLTLDDFGLQMPIKVGDLDPVQDADDETPVMSGIQARLNNLGFWCGSVDGLFGPKTKAALQAFQRKVLGREDPDGEPDSESRHRLLSEHGC